MASATNNKKRSLKRKNLPSKKISGVKSQEAPPNQQPQFRPPSVQPQIQVPQNIQPPSKMEQIVQNINQSKYFAGIIMILMNMGSRYISMELSDRHESILGHPIVRRLMLFTVFFTATRDIWISLILTACFVILVTGVFHDNSKFCMIPKRYRKGETIVTKDDISKAEKILALARKQSEKNQSTKKGEEGVKNKKGSNKGNMKKNKSGLGGYDGNNSYLQNLENFKNYRRKNNKIKKM